MNFPSYYRKAGRCMKVLSPTEMRTIILPPDSLVAERFTSRYPDLERLTEQLKGSEECTAEKFKEFLTTFYSEVDSERNELNKWTAMNWTGVVQPKE